MLSLLNSRPDEVVIKCPMCSTAKSLEKSKIKDKKFVSLRCTCGTRFYKQIIRKDFTKIDLISAIARFDLETLWYKCKRMLFLNPDTKSDRIRLA